MEECLQLYFEITNKCNLKCLHCYLSCDSKSNQSVPTQDAIRVIREFASLGGKYITFSGGEPTYYEEWPLLAKIANELGLETTIITNGMNIERYISVVKDLGIKVGLSVDSVNKITYEKIRRGASFDRLVQAVSMLEKASISNLVIICYTPMKLNYCDLPEIFKFMSKVSISSIYISILEMRGATLKYREFTYLNDSEKLCFLNQLYTLYLQYDHVYNICVSNFRGFMERVLDSEFGIAEPLDRTMRIDASGNVSMTAYLDDENFLLGNIHKYSLKHMWNSQKVDIAFTNAKKDIEIRCAKCKWYSLCLGGSAMLAYQNHNSFSLPDDWCQAKKKFLDNYFSKE